MIFNLFIFLMAISFISMAFLIVGFIGYVFEKTKDYLLEKERDKYNFDFHFMTEEETLEMLERLKNKGGKNERV